MGFLLSCLILNIKQKFSACSLGSMISQEPSSILLGRLAWQAKSFTLPDLFRRTVLLLFLRSYFKSGWNRVYWGFGLASWKGELDRQEGGPDSDPLHFNLFWTYIYEWSLASYIKRGRSSRGRHQHSIILEWNWKTGPRTTWIFDSPRKPGLVNYIIDRYQRYKFIWS